jgi:hypothetical protein
MLIDDDAGRRRVSRWAIGWVVFGAVFAIFGAAALILEAMGKGEAEVSAPTTERKFACAQVVAPGHIDDGYCARLVKDAARRPELTAEQEAQLAGQVEAVEHAMHELNWCDTPMVPPPYRSQCAGISPGPQPTQAHVDALHKTLVDAGFGGAIIRLARTDDPAPKNTIIYAVPVGEACVIGYMQGLGNGGGHQVLAPLPDGRCLAS